MTENKIELKEDERYCFKCKEIVDKKEFNAYFEICWECVHKSGH